DGFIWSEAALKAFNKLKQALLCTPILRLPDFSKNFVVECDASSDGMGAILSQDDHPVAYLKVAEIKSGLQTDPYTSDIIQKLLSPDSSSVSDFSFVDQFLFYKHRLVIPNISNLKVRLLEEAHDTPSGLLQPLPVPTRIWEDISMDFMVGLPPSGRFDTILVVVDRLSKYAHFICLSHPFTTKVVASVFCKEIARLHGFPLSIVCDRDVVFLGHFWQELFRLTQTKLQLSTSYHPQTDGQTKVINRGLEVYLRCFAHEQPVKWSSYLPWVEYSYNTSYHTSTVDRDDMLILIRHNLHKVQDRMRQQTNCKRRDISFEVGDYVFENTALPPAKFGQTQIRDAVPTVFWALSYYAQSRPSRLQIGFAT
nr:hypothetical protein [Tanacetum cinerariifolium]